MKSKIFLSFILLPGSLYFSYGPPIKKIIGDKYLVQLNKECSKNTPNPESKKFCIDAGKIKLDKCKPMINILNMRSGFPKCLEKHSGHLKNCLNDTAPDKCLEQLKAVNLFKKK